MLAYTLLGVDYNDATGAIKFLILDPHYVGPDNIKNIKNKWCAWKDASLFRKDSFYNLCLPQRPKGVWERINLLNATLDDDGPKKECLKSNRFSEKKAAFERGGSEIILFFFFSFIQSMDWFGTRKKEEEVSPVALEGEECKVYMIDLLTKYFHALSYLQLPTATALMKDKRVHICPSPQT